MSDKSLGEHFLDFVEKMFIAEGVKFCEEDLERFGRDGDIDQTFCGYLIAVLDTGGIEYLVDNYHFENIVGEATNIFKERQKQLELEF